MPPEEYPSRVTLLNNHSKQFGKNLESCSIAHAKATKRNKTVLHSGMKFTSSARGIGSLDQMKLHLQRKSGYTNNLREEEYLHDNNLYTGFENPYGDLKDFYS